MTDEEKKSVEAFTLDDEFLERVYVTTDTPSVDRFIQKMGHRLSRDENDELYFSIRNIYIAHAIAYDVKGTLAKQVPSWMKRAATESKYATEAYYDSERDCAWTIDDLIVLTGKFRLSVARTIREDMSAPYYYSDDLGGWVFFRNDVVADSVVLDEIIERYGFDESPHFRSSLNEGSEGVSSEKTDWRAVLEPAHKKALAEGFDEPELPDGLAFKDHQGPVVSVMSHQGSTLLGDQVGLGKTVEFIGGLLGLEQHLEREYDSTPLPCMVIATKSMAETLVKEIQTWRPGSKVELLEGKAPGDVDEDVDFIVSGMHLIHDRLDDILQAEPRSLIIDEAHNFKRMEAKRTEAAVAIADAVRENSGDFPYVVCASGTPFVNRPAELWTILHILGWQDKFIDYAKKKLGKEVKARIKTRSGMRTVNLSKKMIFEKRWCDGFSDKYGAWQNGGSSNREELHRMLIESGMIRRLKSDVMNPLPELTECLTEVTMSLDEARDYEEVANEFRLWATDQAKAIAEEEGVSVAKAVNLMQMKLKSNEPIMKMTAERQKVGEIKVPTVVQKTVDLMEGRLDNADDPMRRKVIIYAFHKKVQKAILEAPELQEYGIGSILAGNKVTGADSVDELKERFQTDDSLRIIVLTMEAREGHTLTAASDVFLAEIPFVPSWVVQMAGRCWARFSREFAPHSAWVHFFWVRNSIDDILLRMNKRKKIDFNSVIDGIEISEEEERQIESQSGMDVFLDHVHSFGGELGIAS